MYNSKLWKILLVCIVGISIPYTCLAAKAPKYSFVRPSHLAPPVDYFDYIVVGGGTAGCPLAATLSNGAKVLVLERGGSPYGNKQVEDIRSFVPNLFSYLPTSPAQRFISLDGVANARARVLGGGSAVNAGFYSRADPGFVKRVGLDYGLVNQSYEWVEKKVAFEPPMLQFQTAVKDGLLQSGVLPYNGFTYDHVPGTKFGGIIFDKNGLRHTAADLLEYANPQSITVYLHATTHKILFNKKGSGAPRATGVLFKDSFGLVHEALLRPGAKNEVIVSSGAIGSPQLLMLSGIGPSIELALHGIEVLLDNPFVGKGLADNPMNAITIPSLTSMETSLIQAVGITDFGTYIEASSGTTTTAFIQQPSKSFPTTSSESSQRFEVPNTITTPEAVEFLEAITNGTYNSAMVLEKIASIKSTGYLHLISLDPNDTPAVKFNYFEEPEDLEKCVHAIEAVIKVIDTEPILKFRIPGMSTQTLINIMVGFPMNYRPRHLDSAFSLEQFCKDTVMTIWHYHGGCQVNRVVDRNYKVLGTQGLRVIDGSTFYESPGTNPQATVMMLGRYMGQKILQGRH